MSEETTETQAPAPEADAQQDTFSLDYVQALRSEAAKYRNDKKVAVQQAKDAAAAEYQVKLDAVTQQQVELQQKAHDAVLQVAKYQAMIDAGIPTDVMADVISLIGGHDDETIAASVAAAKKLMGATTHDAAVDPRQGFGSPAALNSDDLENALRRSLGI